MRRILFCILSILIIIASCFTVASAQSDDPSKPSLDYWDTVMRHIKCCTYYTNSGEAPPDESSESFEKDSEHTPIYLNYNYNIDYVSYLDPSLVRDVQFYRSNYDNNIYNAAYYFDIPLNLIGGSLSFSLNYSGNGSINYYDDGSDIDYFMSFNDLCTNPETIITCYKYNSFGVYELATKSEFNYYTWSSNGSYKFTLRFNFTNIDDLSYIKLVVKTVTPEIIQVGGYFQNIRGRIPFYHYLTLSDQFIYIPPTYEDNVLNGIGDLSNKLDSMLFPDDYVSGQVDDLNNKFDNTQQNVDDLMSGLEIDKPTDLDDIKAGVDSYFNFMNFEYANNSIGRFWDSSVVIRMLMIVGFFSYISFILFGKKA